MANISKPLSRLVTAHFCSNRIPIQIKTKLIQAKRAKLNQAFDAIEGALGKFSNLGGGGGGGHSSGGFGGGHGNLFGGSSGSSSSAGSGASSGSISGNGGYSYQAPAQSYQPQQSFQPQQSYQPQQVQSFHPQPAPQANYQQHPVVVHFYQVEVPTQQVQAQSHSSSFGQSAGGSFVAQQEQVATPAFVPEPIQAYRPEPVATPYHPEPVHQEYGPPPPSSYVPPPSGSFSSSGAVSQVSSQVQPQNSYLPPHQGCQDASHYH